MTVNIIFTPQKLLDCQLAILYVAHNPGFRYVVNFSCLLCAGRVGSCEAVKPFSLVATDCRESRVPLPKLVAALPSP
jgi:hypothetical protein